MPWKNSTVLLKRFIEMVTLKDVKMRLPHQKSQEQIRER
jgi:hypothetical protein